MKIVGINIFLSFFYTCLTHIKKALSFAVINISLVSTKPYFMPEEKKINLNFFQLSPSHENAIPEEVKKQFDEIANAFDNLPENPVPLMLAESKVNLYGKIEKKDGLVLGTFVRNQHTNIPPSYNEADNEVSALPLADGVGLGFPTCFIYDPNVRIIMIESTNNSIGVGLVCNFLQANTKVSGLDALIVINPAKLQDFLNMTVIAKIQFKIARIQNGTVFDTNKKTSVGQIIHGADATNTDTLECTLTKTKRKKGRTLALEKVRTMVQSLLKFEGTKELKKLVVSGRENDDEEKETINFIEQKLRDNIFVDKKRLIDSFDIKVHYEKMVKIYNVHKKSLNVYKIKKK